MIQLPVEALEAPWRVGSSEPSMGMDCWGVVEYVFRLAGLAPPVLPSQVGSPDRQHSAGAKANPGWRKIGDGERPEELDVVISIPNRNDVHAGVVIDGRALMVATSIKGEGVCIRRFGRIKRVSGVYRRVVE